MRQQILITTILCGIVALALAAFYFPAVLQERDKAPSVLAARTISPMTQNVASHSLTPIASSQWYSSVYESFPTQPLYALPLAVKVAPDGIGFSYPDVDPKPDTVFALYKEDFTIKLSKSFTKPRITSLGDWSIGLTVPSGINSASFTLAHGVPFTTVSVKGNEAILSFPNGYELYPDNAAKQTDGSSVKIRSFAVQTRGRWYIISFPKEKTLALSRNTITVTFPEKVFVGLLDARERYSDFAAVAGVQVLGTKATPSVAKLLSVRYDIVTDIRTPLIALYPHQYDALSDPLPVIGTYKSLRGPLRLVKTGSFTTSTPAAIPPDSYPPLRATPLELKQQITKDTEEFLKKPRPTSKAYFLGKWFGTASDLILLADMAGMQKERDALRNYIEPVFVDSLRYFTYDKAKTSLIETVPEFGNEKLNDHHFHYGYFIRTASVLAKYNPQITGRVKSDIDRMVKDIANTDPMARDYPYLRTFDVYEGHSWADGYANFPDGNNQESTSEAINAWYGVYLWSKMTKNTKLEQYALYLYNTEIRSTLYYWFNTAKIYDEPYGHPMASIVWGGKADFATWFSNEANMKYGIQILPFTPASSYLGSLGDFASYEAHLRAEGGGEKKPWGDLFLMWKSFYDPEEAFALRNDVTSFEDANSRSLFLYTLYKNRE